MNIADSFIHAAKCYPDKKAVISGSRSYTYEDMNRIINGIAGYLTRLGISREARVAIYMANSPEWIMFYYGAARIGAIPA